MSANRSGIGKLLVIGLGLIGGSLAAGARKQGLAREILAVDENAASLDYALAVGIVDRVSTRLEDFLPQLTDGDMVVLGVPVLSVTPILEKLAVGLAPSVTISDVGSTKGWLVAEATRIWGEIPSGLVPAHPIAGSEKSGVTASRADLFLRHRVIITPTGAQTDGHKQRVEQLWLGLGAHLDEMSAEHHDEILGATSHLPHVLAFALVDALATMEEQGEVLKYAAGGFRDFTRIASSDPAMWRDIMVANRDAISRSIDKFEDHLQNLKDALYTDSETRLMTIFQRAQATRNALVHKADSKAEGSE